MSLAGIAARLRRHRRRVVLWSLIPVLGGLAFGLLSPRPVLSVGCSRVENSVESAWGCLTREGSACYECYYSDGGGFRTCYESPDGQRSFCTDNRDTI